MTKIVSQLDHDGYFVGPVVADESPLEPGVYLIPGGCVDITPPTVQPGKRYKLVSGSWAAEDIPSAPKPTASDMWQMIKVQRDRRKSEGGVKVGTKWFHSDDASRIQQIGLVMMGASIPSNTQWKTMDGSFVTMTQTLAGQIFQASAANDMAIFAAAETHKAAMEASADPASYDFSTGWPKAFGE